MDQSKLEQIQKELESFEVDAETIEAIKQRNASTSVHSFISKLAKFVCIASLLYVILNVGGTAGLVVLLTFIVAVSADLIRSFSEYRNERLIQKEKERFIKQLKSKGLYEE